MGKYWMTWITREIASLQKHKQPQKGLRRPQRGPEKSVSWAHNEDFLKRLVLSGISFLFKSAPIYFDYFILKSLLQGSPSCYFQRRNKSCRLEGQTASAVITSLLMYCKNSQWENVNELAWLCSNKTLLTET